MRTFLMALLGVGLVGLLFVGMVGPLELTLWAALVVAWVVALVRWAVPRDRSALRPAHN